MIDSSHLLRFRFLQWRAWGAPLLRPYCIEGLYLYGRIPFTSIVITCGLFGR